MPIGDPAGYGTMKAGYNSAMAKALMKNNVTANVAASKAVRTKRDATAMGNIRKSANAAMGNAIRQSRGGANAGITAPPPAPTSMPGNNAKKGLGAIKNKGKLAMGIGAAVVGGLAYSGRRGEGSSGGRTGMTRY